MIIEAISQLLFAVAAVISAAWPFVDAFLKNTA
jgi:hypothetical protein